MIPYKQLFRHDPTNGVYGDCCRTVYACLLEIPPEEVPHFAETYWSDLDGWRKAEDEFLAAKGLALLRKPYLGTLEDGGDGLPGLQEYMRTHFPGMYYILAGMSKNGTDHVVICLNGEIVHDPALDDSGIVGPGTGGHYWIERIVDRRFYKLL